MFKFPKGARVFGFRPESWKENPNQFELVVADSIKNNCLPMGWGNEHDLTSWNERLRRKLAKSHSPQALKMLDKYRSLQPGDYVVSVQGKFAVNGTGIVSVPYEYKPADLEALRSLSDRDSYWWNGVTRVEWLPNSAGLMPSQQPWPNQTFFGPLDSSARNTIERHIGDPVGTVYRGKGMPRKASSFGWTKFFEEVANKLLLHRGNRGPLVEAIHQIMQRVAADTSYLQDYYKDGSSGPLRDICPFTAMGIFNRGITAKRRRAIASELAEFLGVLEGFPDTFEGVPLLSNVNSWFFQYERDRGDGDIDALWDVFAAAVNAADSAFASDTIPKFSTAYDAAMAVHNTGWNLTMGLFWVRPWSFPTLDGNSRSYISDVLGLAIDRNGPKRRCSANDYLTLRDSLLKEFKQPDCPVHSFPELSHEAWERGTNKSAGTDATAETVPELKTDAVLSLLAHSRTHAVLLYGPAGTGKTHTAQNLAEPYCDINGDCVRQVQFHPAYAYEDFMEGLRPVRGDDGQISYEVRDGVFKEFCGKAADDRENNYLFIIDEINRGNVPKVMGELMYALEYRDKVLKLPYSGEPFSIPENVHILGTMNSSDRSVAMLDVALRRRFHFVELPPRPDLLSEIEVEGTGIELGKLLTALNTRILKAKGRHHLLGHSYFLPPKYPAVKKISLAELKLRWFHQILPLLEEYFADDVQTLVEAIIGPGWGETPDRQHFVPYPQDEVDFMECLKWIATPSKPALKGSSNAPADED